MDGALEKRSCRLIVIRWKVEVAQQQACTGQVQVQGQTVTPELQQREGCRNGGTALDMN
jgi:hypothetical protein